MSGFEVAGIVLGTIPLIVSGLEYYMKGLGAIQNFRSYERILKRLIMSLNTEHAMLRNIYEKILIGIAPQSRIEEMIADPFGELWREKEIFRLLRLRLWSSFEIFEARVHDMREAMEEMTEKLNIGPSGKVEWTESTSIMKQFKRLKFILQQSFYDEILKRIDDGVSALERLAMLDTELELQRKSRSQDRINKLVNKVSKSIYHALRSAMACNCPIRHDVGLKLSPPPSAAIPKDEDDEITKEFQFQLAISHLRRSQSLYPGPWSEILLQMSKDVEQTASIVTKMTASSKKGGKVSFAVADLEKENQQARTSVVTLSTISSLALHTIQIHPSSQQSQYIGNLCHVTGFQGNKNMTEQCGHIQDPSTSMKCKYEVHVLEYPDTNNEWSLVPLRNLLSNSDLLHHDRLHLAWVVACSALQMRGTPWISSDPSSGEVYIACKESVYLYKNIYIVKNLPEQAQPKPNQTSTLSTGNTFLLSLGILLVEIILGQPIKTLQSGHGSAVEDGITQQVLDYETANSLLGRVKTAGGPRYCNAVEACLQCDRHLLKSSLGQNFLSSEIFAGIVGPLEQDLKVLMMD